MPLDLRLATMSCNHEDTRPCHGPGSGQAGHAGVAGGREEVGLFSQGIPGQQEQEMAENTHSHKIAQSDSGLGEGGM